MPATALDALAAVGGVAEVRPPVDINIPDAPVPAGRVGHRRGGGQDARRPVARRRHHGRRRQRRHRRRLRPGHVVERRGRAATSPTSTWRPTRSAWPMARPATPLQTQSTHGNAVAEIVHDMAPGADLYLVYAQTDSDLRAAVDWIAAQGITIVNRSQGAPLDGPGNGTGPLADVAAYAVSKNMTWFNSAGNAAGGGYWRGGWYDPDGDGFLNWNGSDESLAVNVNPCAVALGFRWSDWGPASTRTDYDVYIDTNNDGAFTSSDLGWQADQQRGAPPIEMAAGVLGSCSGGAEDREHRREAVRPRVGHRGRRAGAAGQRRLARVLVEPLQRHPTDLRQRQHRRRVGRRHRSRLGHQHRLLQLAGSDQRWAHQARHRRSVVRGHPGVGFVLQRHERRVAGGCRCGRAGTPSRPRRSSRPPCAPSSPARPRIATPRASTTSPATARSRCPRCPRPASMPAASTP